MRYNTPTNLSIEWAKNDEEVRGLIILGSKDPKLDYALKEIQDKIGVKLYKITFQLEKY